MAIVDDDTGAAGTLAKFQTFALEITNTAGTLQHRIIGDVGSMTASGYADRVVGASATLANTPSVSASVGFTSGAGIEAAAPQRVILNTAAQVDSQFGAMVVVERNSTATAGVSASARNITLDVNGVTRNRLCVGFLTPAGNNFTITTANVGNGTTIRVRVWAWIL